MSNSSHMDATELPYHLGFILDGNRRWARQNGLPTLKGHEKGYNNFLSIAEKAFEKGVSVVSGYIFSTENWNRAEEEVDYLMKLSLKMFQRDLEKLNRKGIRVVWLGMPEKLRPELLKAIEKAENQTRENTRGILALCLNYGGQTEIADAVNRIIEKRKDDSKITPADIEKELYHSDEVPPLDMIIRTSGEQRISNFMLWRAAYSELYFINKHWPDFSEKDLDDALNEYSRRERRHGK